MTIPTSVLRALPRTGATLRVVVAGICYYLGLQPRHIPDGTVTIPDRDLAAYCGLSVATVRRSRTHLHGAFLIDRPSDGEAYTYRLLPGWDEAGVGLVPEGLLTVTYPISIRAACIAWQSWADDTGTPTRPRIVADWYAERAGVSRQTWYQLARYLQSSRLVVGGRLRTERVRHVDAPARCRRRFTQTRNSDPHRCGLAGATIRWTPLRSRHKTLPVRGVRNLLEEKTYKSGCAAAHPHLHRTKPPETGPPRVPQDPYKLPEWWAFDRRREELAAIGLTEPHLRRLVKAVGWEYAIGASLEVADQKGRGIDIRSPRAVARERAECYRGHCRTHHGGPCGRQAYLQHRARRQDAHLARPRHDTTYHS